MLNIKYLSKVFITSLIIITTFSCNQNGGDTSAKSNKIKRPKASTDRPSTVDASDWILNEFGNPKMTIKSPVKLKKESVNLTSKDLEQIEKIQFWASNIPQYKIDNISTTFAIFDTESVQGDSTLFLTMVTSSSQTIKEFTSAKNMTFDYFQNGVTINGSPGILQIINVADSINFYNAFFLKESNFYHVGLVGRNTDNSNDACNEIIGSISID